MLEKIIGKIDLCVEDFLSVSETVPEFEKISFYVKSNVVRVFYHVSIREERWSVAEKIIGKVDSFNKTTVKMGNFLCGLKIKPFRVVKDRLDFFIRAEADYKKG